MICTQEDSACVMFDLFCSGQDPMREVMALMTLQTPGHAHVLNLVEALDCGGFLNFRGVSASVCARLCLKDHGGTRSGGLSFEIAPSLIFSFA